MAGHADCTSTVLSHGAPSRKARDFVLPALWLRLGHRPAHDIRCLTVGKRFMSTPISATITLAAVALTPGMGLCPLDTDASLFDRVSDDVFECAGVRVGHVNRHKVSS